MSGQVSRGSAGEYQADQGRLPRGHDIGTRFYKRREGKLFGSGA